MNNKIKVSTFDKCFDTLNVLFQTCIALIMLYPMLYVIIASVSESSKLMAQSGFLWKPLGFSFDAYKAAFNNPKLLTGYMNTIFVVVAGVTLNMVLTCCGAYFLSRKNVKYQKIISIYILITMFFSGGMIPFYFVVRSVGLEGSLWSLIIPAGINTFNMMILRVAFEGVPVSLEESAKLDGAGHLRILFSIVLPVTKASLAVIVLYYAVQHWNSWFNAMLFINDAEKYPLQLILREILISNDTAEMTQGVAISDQQSVADTIKYAIIVIGTLPILCVYPFIQKYFTKGVMIGAVKG